MERKRRKRFQFHHNSVIAFQQDTKGRLRRPASSRKEAVTQSNKKIQRKTRSYEETKPRSNNFMRSIVWPDSSWHFYRPLIQAQYRARQQRTAIDAQG
jgi:hypothetical protein